MLIDHFKLIFSLEKLNFVPSIMYMNKKLAVLIVFLTSSVFTFAQKSPWIYRAGVNLNGLRTRTLEVSGQALQKGKVIYTLSAGGTFRSPRNGFQTKAQKNIDSISADIQTSGFFIKPAVQFNMFTIANKFTKADVFIGVGVAQSFYKRNTEITFLRRTSDREKKDSFSGSATAPFVSAGLNLRIIYNVFLDLGVQYNLTKSQTKDNILPERYDWLPGMGGNYKNGNKAALLATVRYQFD